MDIFRGHLDSISVGMTPQGWDYVYDITLTPEVLFLVCVLTPQISTCTVRCTSKPEQVNPSSYSDAFKNVQRADVHVCPFTPTFSGQVVQPVFDPELPGQTIPRSEGPLGKFHSF